MFRARSPRPRAPRRRTPAVRVRRRRADRSRCSSPTRSDPTSRAVDVEQFTDRVEATCDECRVTVYDAEGDAEAQKSQARQAEATSADVIVVVPVEPDDLATMTGQDLPVVSLGTLVPGSDRFVGLEGGEAPSQAGSDLEAARDVLLGDEESMTYVPTRAMSEQAADVAVAFLADTTVEDSAGGRRRRVLALPGPGRHDRHPDLRARRPGRRHPRRPLQRGHREALCEAGPAMIEILTPAQVDRARATGALVADILQSLREPQRGRDQPPRPGPLDRGDDPRRRCRVLLRRLRPVLRPRPVRPLRLHRGQRRRAPRSPARPAAGRR